MTKYDIIYEKYEDEGIDNDDETELYQLIEYRNCYK